MSNDFFTLVKRDPSDQKIFRFAVVAGVYNKSFVDALLQDVCTILEGAGQASPKVIRVPGVTEVPLVALKLALSGKYDVIINLGVICKGDTHHHEVLAVTTAHALQAHAATSGVPMVNGLVCVDTLTQAQDRCIGPLKRGQEYALTAISMAQVLSEL